MAPRRTEPRSADLRVHGEGWVADQAALMPWSIWPRDDGYDGPNPIAANRTCRAAPTFAGLVLAVIGPRAHSEAEWSGSREPQWGPWWVVHTLDGKVHAEQPSIPRSADRRTDKERRPQAVLWIVIAIPPEMVSPEALRLLTGERD